MADEKEKPTSTARVNAYRKRAGGRTITTHLPDTYLQKLYRLDALAGGQKEAIITAIMALELLLKGSTEPEEDMLKIRTGRLPSRLKGRKATSCKQQAETMPGSEGRLLQDH